MEGPVEGFSGEAWRKENAMEMRCKEFAVRAEITEVSEEDLALINGEFALAPLTAEEVYVRKLALCNDRYDRTLERFLRAHLVYRSARAMPVQRRSHSSFR